MSVSENCELAFSIPQIQESIFCHGNLSPRDLANASLVNRVWFQIVSPFLWENVTIANNNPSQEWSNGFISGLASHGRWTRTLSTASNFILNWCSQSPHCTRLLAIYASPLSNCLDEHGLKNLVSRNSELKILRWRSRYFDDYHEFCDISEGLMTASSRFLTILDLAKIQVGSSLYKVLEHHSVTMKHLSLEQCCIYADTSYATKQDQLNLQSFTSKGNVYYNWAELSKVDCFLLLLGMANSLLEFTLETDDKELIQLLPRLFTGIRGSNIQDSSSLESLEVLNVKGTHEFFSLEGISPEELLDVLPNSLYELNLNGFAFRAEENEALLNFAKRNQDRLTCISLMRYEVIHSQTWETILTHCRYLKEIEGCKESVLEIIAGDMEPWVCLDLQYFGVHVSVGCFRSVEKSLGRSENSVATGDMITDFSPWDEYILKDCEAFFGQLSLLTCLEKLNISLYGMWGSQSWKLSETDADERFLSLWSSLETCRKLKAVNVGICILEMKTIRVKMEEISRQMWGEKINLGIVIGEEN